MNVQLRLAARYLAGRKLRTALTTLAIVFGVMLLFGLNGIMPAMLESLQRSMVAASGETDLTVVSKSGGTFEPVVAEQVASVPGIAAATPILKQVIALVPGDYPITTLTIIGIDPETANRIKPFAEKDGSYFTAEDVAADRAWAADPEGVGGGPSGVMLPVPTADAMGLEVGDTLALPSALGKTEIPVTAVLDMVTTPGSDEAYLTLPAAQAVLGQDDRISEVDAAFETGADRAAVEADVSAAVGEPFRIGTLDQGTSLFAALKVSSFIINMFGVLALVMAGFIILNTFRTVVSERRHDIGMLRAIGASQRTILGIFLIESVLQGILGTALGILAGYWLANAAISGLGSIYNDLLKLSVGKPVFTASTWALAITMGIGVTVLSALVPARAAARITPLDALRPQMGDVYEKVVIRRAIVGVVIVLAAIGGLVSGNAALVGWSSVVFLVGLALVTPALVKPVTDAFSRAIDLAYRREGGLARANLQRNAGRAAVTASAMMLSVAVIIALMGVLTSVMDGFMGYLDKSMGADYLIIPSNMLLSTGTVAASSQFVEEIAATEGVGDVATLRLGRASTGETSMQVIGIDPEAYAKVASFQFSEGSSDADLARLSEKGTIMVNGLFAAQNGLAKGDTLTLETPEGRRSFEVVAIGSDYLNAKLATAYVSQAELERDFGVTTDVLVMANASEGADADKTFQALARVVDGYPSFSLYETETWRNLQLGTFDQVMSAYYFLLVVLALPSLLALVNTLAIGVLARTREIGMLRAIGSTRRQVRRMVAAESLLLASLGTLLGIVAGIWLGYSMVDAMNAVGFPSPYFFPYNGILIALVLGVVVAIAAALIPARQATRMDVVAALHYE